MKNRTHSRSSFRSTNHSNHPSRQAWGNRLQRNEFRTLFVRRLFCHQNGRKVSRSWPEPGSRDTNTLNPKGRAFRFGAPVKGRFIEQGRASC
jgi:hypothetical protein